MDRTQLSNWRPITLTNTDYKIYSKALALRLQLVLNDILHHNQKGFIKGRSITETIRQIDDTLSVCRHLEKGGILASLDIRKAFDSVDKTAILNQSRLNTLELQ